MQQQTTTSSRKRTSKFVFKNNSLKVFFKMPKAFFMTLLPQYSCLLKSTSSAIWRTFPICLWRIMKHGNKGYHLSPSMYGLISLSILRFNHNSSPFTTLPYKLEIPKLWASFIKLGIPTNTSLNCPQWSTIICKCMLNVLDLKE